MTADADRSRTARAMRAVVGAGLLFAPLTVARPSMAHPAGLSSVNRYIGVECKGPGRVHIEYWIDFAELPAYVEIEDLDANHDDTVSPEEQTQYLARRLPPLVRSWTLALDDEKATPHVTGSRLEVTAGERGLSTLRIAADVEVESRSPADASATQVRVFVRDLAFADRPGWRELAADDSAEAVVVSGPKHRSGDALAYGASRQAAPPRVNEAEFTFRLGHGLTSQPHAPGPAPAFDIDPRLARLASALRDRSGSGPFPSLALGLAALLGAVHAMSPGHGKALAAATLVGTRATPMHALLFGATVAASHTGVVFLLGAFAMAIERHVGSGRVIRWLEFSSAVTVAVLGFVQFTSRWRSLASHSTEDHGGGLSPHGLGSVATLGALSGLVPCSTAIAVWLAAVAVHRAALGLLLVVAFSAGVAATLTAVGLLVVLTRRVVVRTAPLGPILAWLPVISSACVAAIGVLLCAAAWSTNGGP